MRIINLIRQSVFLATLFLCCSFVWAEDSGQIINVNQGFKIAFTDLGNRALKPNDIVKVFISRDEFLYMKVIECSPILSKLGPVQEEAYKTILQDLPRISVGNLVVKLTAASQEEPALAEVSVETKAAPETASKPDSNSQKLEQELIEARNENKNLKEINAALESKINDLVLKAQMKEAEVTVPPEQKITNDENIIIIKTQLEKMQKLMNQN